MVHRYQDPRWQKLRLEVMQRDDWTCQGCLATDRPLHVHHVEYHGQIWETPPEKLQTLCVICHELLGPHPKGGVCWSWPGERLGGNSAHFSWIHCPICGSKNLKDKGSWEKCMDCGHRIQPVDYPLAVGQ